MPEQLAKYCMECSTELSQYNTTGICKDCKQEQIRFVPSQARIKRMCEMFKRKNLQRDMERGNPKTHHIAVEDFSDDYEGDD